MFRKNPTHELDICPHPFPRIGRRVTQCPQLLSVRLETHLFCLAISTLQSRGFQCLTRIPFAVFNMPAAEEPVKTESRLLLVSNRLPITIKRSEDGKYDFSMSSGGLVSGLSGLSKATTFLWYGWPGLKVPEDEVEDMKKKLKDDYGAVPVFIDDDLAEKHYNGFSSQDLPPLLPIPYLTLSRLHTVAALSLSPRRDHLRRGGLGSSQAGESFVCQSCCQRCPRR